MKIKPAAVAALVLTAVTAFGTAACDPGYAAGPSGKVTDRSAVYFKSGGWRYKLTTTSTFRVTRDEYRGCVRGSSYPKCAGK